MGLAASIPLEWIVDSGAASHVAPEKKVFKIYMHFKDISLGTIHESMSKVSILLALSPFERLLYAHGCFCTTYKP